MKIHFNLIVVLLCATLVYCNQRKEVRTASNAKSNADTSISRRLDTICIKNIVDSKLTTPILLESCGTFVNEEISDSLFTRISGDDTTGINIMYTERKSPLVYSKQDSIYYIDLYFTIMGGVFYLGEIDNKKVDKVILSLGIQKKVAGFPDRPSIYKLRYKILVPDKQRRYTFFYE